MKIYMLIVMFFLVGAFFIISENNLALKSPANIDKFFSTYANWIDGTFGNFGQVTGYVLKMDWLPNQTSVD